MGLVGNFFKRLSKTMLILFFSGVVIFGILVFIAWNNMPLPPDVVYGKSTKILDAKGNQIGVVDDGQNRIPVKFNDIPKSVIDSIVAVEDKSYFEHHGVDPRGVARALWVDARGNGGLQGGSTITQQYVKQAYVGTERTAWRKFREAILSVKLEDKYSKQDILERYLNTIYWGRGAYGIQSASKVYFKKDMRDLNLQETVYLASIIRGPELADVYKSPDTATLWRDRALEKMVKNGNITEEQSNKVKSTPMKSYVAEYKPVSTKSTAKDGTQYFVAYVKQLLYARYGEQMVQTGGLTVKTTLDPDLQSKAYSSIYGFLKVGEPSGALVSVDENGYIKAMVGGRDWNTSQVNLSLGRAGGGSGRHAGSTFKPFELATAIEGGVCVEDRYSGPAKKTISIPREKDWTVENFNNEPFGSISLVEATVRSVNTVYAQLVVQTGTQALIDTSKSLGITSSMAANPSLVLGATEVSPLEMTEAYLTFANRGLHSEVVPILEIKNSSGSTLEKASSKGVRAIEENTADTVNYALSQVVQRGTGTAAQIGKPVAGKTGTTDDFGDAWFIGYTPHMTTAVWMGYPDGSSKKMSNVRGRSVVGGSYPAQIFSNYMKYATRNDKSDAFEKADLCKTKTKTKTKQNNTTAKRKYPTGSVVPTTDSPATTDTTEDVSVSTTEAVVTTTEPAVSTTQKPLTTLPLTTETMILNNGGNGGGNGRSNKNP